MKSIILIAPLVFISYVAMATTYQWGDTTEVELISFESESLYFVQGTPTTNIWQVGPPTKTLFTQAYSGTNAVATDTLNPYPTNNHSWFDLVLPRYVFENYLGIEFMQKLNTSPNLDGGYITVSYDLGASWINIIQDTATGWHWSETPTNNWTNLNVYSSEDTLYNGEFGFSGERSEWEKVLFAWFNIPVKKSSWSDTMIVRFNFISDTIPENRDGWMIDNICLFWVDLGGNVHEKPITSNLDVYPNPMSDKAVIRTKNQQLIQKAQVFNLHGQLVKQEVVESNEYLFHKVNIEPGIYFVKCTFSQDETETVRLIVQ